MAISPNSVLERITVNLVQRTSRALRLSMQLSGNIKTDVINQDIQMGAYIRWILAQPGGKILVQEPGDKRPHLLRFTIGLEEPTTDDLARIIPGVHGAVPDNSEHDTS